MSCDLVTASHLDRKAVVYIRQSSPHQVLTNRESLRLQYALRQRARELGWREADGVRPMSRSSTLTSARAAPGPSGGSVSRT